MRPMLPHRWGPHLLQMHHPHLVFSSCRDHLLHQQYLEASDMCSSKGAYCQEGFLIGWRPSKLWSDVGNAGHKEVYLLRRLNLDRTDQHRQPRNSQRKGLKGHSSPHSHKRRSRSHMPACVVSYIDRNI